MPARGRAPAIVARRAVLPLWIAVVSTLLPGCGAEPPPIGVLLPKSAVWGREAEQGLRLAYDELPEEGRPVLREADSGGTTQGAIDGFQMLVRSGATVVLGPFSTDTCIGTGVVADDLRVPFVSPSATAAVVTRDSDYALRVCYSDDEVARGLAAFATEDLELTRVALLVDLSRTYALGLAECFTDELARRHGRIVAEIGFWPDDEDLGDTLDRLVAVVDPETPKDEASVQAVFVAGFGRDIVPMLRGATDKRVEALVLLGADGWNGAELRQLIPGRVAAAYHTSHFSIEEQDPAVARFDAAYRARYGEAPSDMAALVYDAARVIFSVYDPRADGVMLRTRLRSVRRFGGVTGEIDLDFSGEPVGKSIVLEQIHDPGQPGFVRRL